MDTIFRWNHLYLDITKKFLCTSLMPKLITLVVLLFSYCNLLLGQSKIVVDKQFHRPISFVNIGNPAKKTGTISDEKGVFNSKNFKSNLNSKDSLIISAVGYEKLKISYTDLKLLDTIFLIKKTFNLNELIVTEKIKKSRTLKAGNKHFSKIAYTGFNTATNPNDILEIGKQIEFRKDSILVTKLNFHVHSTSSNKATFRINFYEYDDKLNVIGENFLPKPIIIETNIELGWNSIDLSQHLVKSPKIFIVSMEYIPVNTLNPLFHFSTSLVPAKNTFMKIGSNQSWETTGSNLSLYLSGKHLKHD